MAEYIEREAVLMYAKMFIHIAYSRSNPLRDEEIKKAVNEIPAADVAPVRHGRWQITDAYPHNVYCSECHKRFAQTHWAVWEDGSLPRAYCPNCMAKMDLEGESEKTQ